MNYLAADELQAEQKAVRLGPFTADGLREWKAHAPGFGKDWVEGSGFNAAPGQHCALPGDKGRVAAWLLW